MYVHIPSVWLDGNSSGSSAISTNMSTSSSSTEIDSLSAFDKLFTFPLKDISYKYVGFIHIIHIRKCAAILRQLL